VEKSINPKDGFRDREEVCEEKRRRMKKEVVRPERFELPT
jgi:hypothetical protein